MKRVAIAGVIAVFCAVVAAGMWAADHEGPEGGETVTWQHLAFEHDASRGFADADLSKRIVSLGKQGWELVTVANFAEGGTTAKTVFYFKKPRRSTSG